MGWDCSPGSDNPFTRGSYEQGDVEHSTGTYSARNKWEDFAESMAAAAYPETLTGDDRALLNPGSQRYNWLMCDVWQKCPGGGAQ
jgi:hypothetical protein